MTKQEFMYRLAQQLVSLPPEERVCALKFYDEYFADAGEENADAVIRDLGSPEEASDYLDRVETASATPATSRTASTSTALAPSTSPARGARPTPPTPAPTTKPPAARPRPQATAAAAPPWWWC